MVLLEYYRTITKYFPLVFAFQPITKIYYNCLICYFLSYWWRKSSTVTLLT
jgi:hypothetical protein